MTVITANQSAAFITVKVGSVLLNADEQFGIETIDEIHSTRQFIDREHAERWITNLEGEFEDVGDGWYFPASARDARDEELAEMSAVAAWIEE